MTTNLDHGSRAFDSKWLILPKVLYFWLNMAIYTATTFITKFFMNKWKLLEYQVAVVMSLQITIFFGAMFWTNLADRLRKPRMLLMMAIVGYAVFFCCLGLPIFLRPDQGLHRLIYSSVILSFTWMCSSCFYPLVDSTIMMMLERDPNFTKDHYNNQRLWGVPAHVLGGIVSGWAFDKFGVLGYEAGVLISTLIFAVVAFISMPAVMTEDVKKPSKDMEKGQQASASSENLLAPAVQNPTWTLLSKPSFVFFLIFGLSGGILRSSLTNFQSHHMEKGFKMTSTNAAFTTVPRIASEVAVYVFGKHLARYIGVYWMLVLSQVAGLVRIFGYAFFTSPESMFLPFFLEVSKGLNSGLLVTSSVRIASDIAPPGCASSAQGLFSGTYSGLSMFVGGLINGLLLYWSGNNLCFMFKWVGVFSLICTITFFVKYAFFDRVMKIPGFTAKSTA